MATLSGIREQVRNNLYSEYPAEHPFTELAASNITPASATTIPVTDGDNYSVGDVVENVEDGELMFVTAISTNDLTVVRAYQGTTGNVINEGDRLATNPRITVQDVDQKVTDIVEDLKTHGVYAPTTTTVTLDQTKYIYSVALPDVHSKGILAAYYKDPSYGVPVPMPVQLFPAVHADIASDGVAIQIDPGAYDGSATTGYILYAKNYTDASELPSDLEEAVVLGSTGALIGRMVAPALQDPGHLTNRTVPPGQASRDARYFNGQYIVMVRRFVAELESKDWGIGSIRTRRAQRWRR